MVWLLSKSKASTQLGIDEYQAVVTISIEKDSHCARHGNP